MKFTKFLLSAAFVLGALCANAQIFDPVKWTFVANTISATEAEIVATATIEAGWHVYATKLSDKEDAIGPIPTTLELTASKDFKLAGKVTEGKYITHVDPNFEMALNYFENAAVFRQKIRLVSKEPFSVKGVLQYMACNDERCTFPDPENFEVVVTPLGAKPTELKEVPIASDTASTGDALSIPLSWTFASQKISETEFDIVATAKVQPGYHIYSAVHLSEGPMPTEIKTDANSKWQPAGSIIEKPDAHKAYDKDFGTDVYTLEGSAEFRQRISIADASVTEITGELKGMVCREVCTPFSENFKINTRSGVGATYDPLANATASSVVNDPFDWPEDPNEPLNNCGEDKKKHSLWAIFIFGLIGGLLALLTPCVFPMIPLTVSYFTKGAQGSNGRRRAITYGFFIFLIYLILSLPFHLSKNVDPEVLNSIATNVWLNLAFFIIFIVFAISFFGYFEITLPSGLANKVDSASNLSGGIGIFFMALTLAIVSFSCTGPILGTVIGSIYSGDDIQGVVHFIGLELSLPAAKVTAAMAGFGLSLGLPFGIFAAFPSLLKKLPKSGGWLQDFKVSLGFLELAFALKFLSNSDLVEQWGFIKREVFFAVWIVIGALWSLYLLKRFTFKTGYRSTTKLKGFKLVVTIAVILFTMRLVPGLLPASAYNRFDFLSGFPPPKFYSFYHYEEEFRIYKDIAEAMEVAKAEGKPLFLDFTGWACVNCRKMEDQMWPKEQVKALLANEFVMVSLYVDEKVELPVREQFVYQTKDGRKKEIKTVGNKWSTLQTQTFENNSQPMYAIIATDSTILNPIKQYEDREKEYVDWLKCGLEAHKQWKNNQ
ncbi:MAG: protein-disulfide reductase DsbD domain-containing protein [Flavobacteriales bacterium]